MSLISAFSARFSRPVAQNPPTFRGRHPCRTRFQRLCRQRVRTRSKQVAISSHIVSQVLHPDLGLGPRQADAAHERAAHVVRLRAENMLDPDPHLGFCVVPLLGPFAQRLAALALSVNAAFQIPFLDLPLDFV